MFDKVNPVGFDNVAILLGGNTQKMLAEIVIG